MSRVKFSPPLFRHPLKVWPPDESASPLSLPPIATLFFFFTSIFSRQKKKEFTLLVAFIKIFHLFWCWCSESVKDSRNSLTGRCQYERRPWKYWTEIDLLFEKKVQFSCESMASLLKKKFILKKRAPDELSKWRRRRRMCGQNAKLCSEKKALLVLPVSSEIPSNQHTCVLVILNWRNL